jgi:hypothetical protein
MFKATCSVLASLALLLYAAPAWVHHSSAPFDQQKVTRISGIVREFNWTNPHSSFKVEVSKPDGTSEIWSIEMNSPNNLIRQGWKRTTLQVGDKVTVTLHPLRDGRPGGWYLAIDLPDGRHLGT